jgi:hypothetical protein
VIVAAAANTKVLWYLTRGLGVGALLLLTASIVLGVLTTVGWRSPRWPRFVTAGLHRNLTLLAIVVVVLHVLTTVLDGYTPIVLTDALVPFVSAYRPVWLGLGAIAFDLLLALVATSLLRARLGYRTWRAAHWLAYASWPIALVHALGTGSDARFAWLQLVGIGCVAAVVVAVVARFGVKHDMPLPARALGIAAAVVVPVAILTWYDSGPARHGWARRAGTPVKLIGASPKTAVVAQRVKLPRARFASSVRGTIGETTTPAGLVNVVIRGKLGGGPRGAVRIDLRGEPLQGGVSMTASGVSYVPAGTRTVYYGSVSGLQGTRVVAELATHSGARLRLDFVLNIDTRSHVVTGSVNGSPGAA